jgi:type II secretory pathway pseudopilin PulG
MALLMIFIAIMGVMLMKAMPYAIADVKRDQEAELIFRGEAIAKAIRLYQLRTGGYPLSLDQLAQIRPRIIRRIYKDPMTKDGEWRKIYAVQPGASGDATGLPIIGVASQSEGDSYKIYKGRTQYNDWIFAATDSILGIPAGMAVPPPPNSGGGTPAGGDKGRGGTGSGGETKK